MKFAKHLEENSIPEWGDRYLNYRAAKKVLKSVHPEIDPRQAGRVEFFLFLDRELEKVETFYQSKEDEARQRLRVLEEQLEAMEARRPSAPQEGEQQDGEGADSAARGLSRIGSGTTVDASGLVSRMVQACRPALARLQSTVESARNGRARQRLEAIRDFGLDRHADAKSRDHVRRVPPPASYASAKRQLRQALVGYYRGLELLRSYALLNRTAFRKINKKYDKAARPRAPMQFVSERVDHARFVTSDTPDDLIKRSEGLYAQYFEGGNRKVAAGKLRARLSQRDYSGSGLRAGALGGAGTALASLAVVEGVKQLSDKETGQDTKYLLQLYAGYFLLVLLAAVFALVCRAFAQAKVNYPFVFQFDTRHNLDWRQLSEIPAAFMFLLGLVMVMNFFWGGGPMYQFWPAVLVGLAGSLLCFPWPHFYHRSRLWFLFGLWRLLFAGAYAVEFRDFFLGDMFCSESYALGNIELFFCVYKAGWTGLKTCNSAHSRLLGFFSTWPACIRAAQCLRRWLDTRDSFPHLVNCGKYVFTILTYMSLSLWRIDRGAALRALFITIACCNSIYCSTWDIFIDWSLGDPSTQPPFLRPVRAYKQTWWYYAAMALDPPLRFSWVLYVVFENDVQHASIVSFAVALVEVLRRGLWSLFRVENEHCANVSRNRASRDLPLPFDLGALASAQRAAALPPAGTETELLPVDEARASSSLREGVSVSTALRRVGSSMSTAHARDYERRPAPADVEEEMPSEAEDEDGEEVEDLAGAARGPGEALPR